MPVPGSTNVGTVVVSSNINGQFVNSHSNLNSAETQMSSSGSAIPPIGLQSAQFVIKTESGIKQETGANLQNTTVTPTMVLTSSGGQIPASSTQYVIKQDPSLLRTPTSGKGTTIMVNHTVSSGVRPVGSPLNVRPTSTQVQIVSVPNQSRFVAPTSTLVSTPGISKVITPRGATNAPIRIAPQQPVVVQRPLTTNIGVSLPPGHVLVKNDAGHYMLVNNSQTAISATTPFVSPGQPVQSSSSTVIRTGVVTTTQPRPHIVTPNAPQSNTRPVIATPSPSIAATTPVPQQHMEQVKKCKNFLATLIRLAGNQPANTVKQVKDLVQKLIDAKVEPEDFTARLQVELRSAPQPYLVPFLKKNLPNLRQSMVHNQISIDGIQAPPVSVLTSGVTVVQSAVPRLPANIVRTPVNARPQVPGQVQTIANPNMLVRGVNNNIRPVVTQPTLVGSSYTRTPVTVVNNRILSAPGVVNIKNRKPSATAINMANLAGVPQVNSINKDKRKYDSTNENDDINDVATMGGVNLTEESRNILTSNMELMAGQLRTCKDEYFCHTHALMNKINTIAKKHFLGNCSDQIVQLISHATQERMRNIIEKLSITAEHRLEIYKNDKNHISTTQVKSQLKFIEELDRMEKKRHDEMEREELLKAAKSRSKAENPELAKLKEKAKSMKQMEMDQAQHRDANETALAAIGSRKKRKVDTDGTGSGVGTNAASTSSRPTRQRIKRVNLRDLLFLMEQESETSRSVLLYKTYMK